MWREDESEVDGTGTKKTVRASPSLLTADRDYTLDTQNKLVCALEGSARCSLCASSMTRGSTTRSTGV